MVLIPSLSAVDEAGRKMLGAEDSWYQGKTRAGATTKRPEASQRARKQDGGGWDSIMYMEAWTTSRWTDYLR